MGVGGGTGLLRNMAVHVHEMLVLLAGDELLNHSLCPPDNPISRGTE